MMSFIIPPDVQKRYYSISADIEAIITTAYEKAQRSDVRQACINSAAYFKYCKRVGSLSILETINGKGPYRVYIDNAVPDDKVFIFDGSALVRITDISLL